MQLFAILVASLVLSSVVVYVAVNVARETGDVGDIAALPGAPGVDNLPLPALGACARFTLDPVLAPYYEYYINTCESDVYEADCVASEPSQIVYWTTSVNCSTEGPFYDYASAEFYVPFEPYFPCCPATLLQLSEVALIDISGDPQRYEIHRRVCVKIKMSNGTLLDLTPTVVGNRTLTIYSVLPFDTTASISGATCLAANSYDIANNPANLDTDLSAFEIINIVDSCEACLSSGLGNAVSSCEIEKCNIPFALPLYTKVPYVGACARYTPHPILPGYNNTCTMTLEEDCVTSGVPGEIVHWTDERTKLKCRNTYNTAIVEYDNRKRASFPLCPGGYVLFRRTSEPFQDFWCLNITAAWTGYAGNALYLTYAFSDACSSTISFNQTTNIGSIGTFFNAAVYPECLFSFAVGMFSTASTDPFYSPYIGAV